MNNLEMYKSVFDHASVAIGIISTDGKILDINENLREILGYKKDEITNVNLKTLIYHDDLEEVMRNHSKVIDANLPYAHGITRFNNSKKEIIWGELGSVPLYGGEGEIIAFISTFFEIAGQSNSDKLLRKNNDSFNWLFHYYNDNAVIVIDEGMNIIRANNKYREMAVSLNGATEEKLTFSKLIHPDDRERLIKYHYVRREKKEQAPNKYHCRIIYNDGTSYKHLLNVAMIPGTTNSLVSISDQVTTESLKNKVNDTDNVFRLLAENATDQIFILDNDFNINYISPSVERISGYTQEEFKILTPEEYMTPESFKNVKKFYTAELQESYDLTKIRRMELQVVHKNGSLIWIETLVKFIIDENEEPLGILGSSRDISERKTAEEALRASEERYRFLTEGIRDLVMLVSTDLIIEYISPSVSDFSECLPEEITGTHISEYFVDGDEYKSVLEHFSSSFRKQKSATACEFRIKIRNEDAFYVEVTVNPSFKDGKIVIAQCVARDISERKKAEKRLKEEGVTLSNENLTLKKSIIKSGRFGNIIGKSHSMLKVYELILKAVPSNANIIIYGESGTGKELVAQAVHEMSDRVDKPFVIVNCGAIPENIIESEFFGYKKGAFTGAVKDKEGFLDLADGGTLFLDEIGEIGLNMQVKLLRAIEGGGYSPVGSSEVKKPKLHIVAATNRNLNDLVLKGKMREDFYFRVHVIPIHLPSLKERKEDIPLLMDHFLTQYRKNNVAENIPLDVKKAFINYHWPGNVRELQNALYRYLAINRIDFLDTLQRGENAENMFKMTKNFDTENSTLSSMMEKFEKLLIEKELNKNNWNKSKTATVLKIDRKTLASKIKKYQLQSDN